MLKSAIGGIKLITNSERLVYVLWFASGSPGLSGPRCLYISRVAYTWNPTVSRGSTEKRLQSEVMVAQTQKIQALENQLDTVQYDQQANGARSIVPSVLGRVPATINTGVTAPVPARAPVLSGKKNNKKKFGANYIENDIPNGERSK